MGIAQAAALWIVRPSPAIRAEHHHPRAASTDRTQGKSRAARDESCDQPGAERPADDLVFAGMPEGVSALPSV